ncbi:10217_t:CDS:2 [Diversispora eburnea]|uniref:10217_t:CDS:1 n=1 Tax=Diversispora eburnea TaxID=1213867 RepID=A0A9N8VYL9_9GLOM|nr:10217_t:CDS:2 [Diversispora eburnea]
MSNNNLLRLDTSFSFSTPSSSRASSVIPDEEYEDVPFSISTPSSSSACSVIPDEEGRVVNNEMAEALSSRYTKEVGEKFLGDPVSIQDRKDLRKYNTGVRFLDGLHQHSKNKKKKPCRNCKYDDYKFLRSTINPGPYEDCEWEELKWKPFSNPKISPNKWLQVRRDELNKWQRERGILVLPPTFLMDDYFEDDHSSNIMDDY